MMRRLSNFILALLIALSIPSLCQAIEAKWTPAEDNEQDSSGGPLPLSQNQRDQLLQLEDAIVNSPDPQGTLVQVAESNGMSPRELVDLLERNRADMEASGMVAPRQGGGGGGMSVRNTLPRRILGIFLGLFTTLGKLAKAHPQAFSVIFTGILLSLYATVQAPRTGIVMSTGPNALLLSSGHSTFFVPPAKYVSKYMESNKFVRAESSLPKKAGKAGSISRVLVEEMEDRDALDGTAFIKAGRKSVFSLAVAAQKTVDLVSIVPELANMDNSGSSNDEDEDNIDLDDKEKEEDERALLVQDATEAAFDAALTVLSSRRFTEFATADGGDKELMRFQSTPSADKRKGGAVLIVKSMGDFGRYGLQPLRIAHQEEGTDSASIVYYTLKGGHFDGEIRFAVKIKDSDEEDDGDVPSIAITASLVVPRKGRKLSKKQAERIVSTLVESMAVSVTTQAKQSLARRHMSSRYRGRVSAGATERRHIRFENERKMEEMAEDRRRRWQRSNPDAGRYRPSGRRMQSPNNC